ncbi:MAG: hypothetical protein EOM50_05510 [Erysipelotrichia bacterium]|nr:hypothetical protein [Erysipelotrichia bacterium]
MKKILVGIFSIFFCVFSLTSMHANEIPSVTFDGTSTLKYSEEANNFSSVFEGMHSGETRELSIQLVNHSDKEVDFFMNTEVLQSLEKSVQSNGAGYNVSLKLAKGNEDHYIFGSEEGALVGANENGLYDLNGTLNEKYLLTSLGANEKAVLSLVIGIDGTTSRNDYQASVGELQMDFSVSYEENVMTNVVKNVVNKVTTGDPTSISTLVMLLLISGGAIYVSCKKLKGDKR